MANNGIHTLNVKNFKAFKNVESFVLNGKNLLVYGENGSGKSSLYFSIYTLLQATTRPALHTQKYFEITSPEHLLNIHNPYTEDSFIELSLTDNPDSFYKVTKTGLDFTDESLKDINLASDFISHRLLINFYNFRNSKEINLFNVFERDIWPFTTPTGKTELFATTLDQLRAEAEILTRSYYTAFEHKLNDLNRDIQELIHNINEKATNFYTKHFSKNEELYKIILEYAEPFKVVGRSTDYIIENPHIRLTLSVKMADGSFKKIERPQSYLNESKLTAIGLTIRLVVLLERPATPEIKLLVLDDMLISLDMSNRMQVIDIIFNVFKPDYQIILLTHDFGFYREIKRRTYFEPENWVNLEFFADEATNHPSIKNGKTDLEKAQDYLTDKDFEACAIQLRKATEAVLRNFCEKKMEVCFDKNTFITLGQYLNQAKAIIDKNNFSKFRSIIESSAELKEKFNILLTAEGINPTDPTFATLTNQKKGELIAKLKATEIGLFKELFDFLVERQTDEIAIGRILDEVLHLKNRILNQGAHASDAPLYEQELIDAMDKIYVLQELLK
jgi:ABC-type Mn2+/Zn2+ transport system ATPase subunit